MTKLLNKVKTEAGITYNSLHWWIRRTLGSASKCENPNCLGKSKFYEWALRKGKAYDRKPENFIQLCRSCHFNYDLKKYQKDQFDKGRIKAQKVRIGTHHTKESRLKMSKSLKGRKAWNKGKKWSEEAKKKMSLSHLGKIPWNKGKKNI